MENKINLEEFILHQLDWSLDMKARLEAKATGYLAVATLSLTLVFQILTHQSTATVPVLLKLCRMTFIVGLLILVFCSLMLFPKKINYFKAQWLLDIYKENPPANEVENRILKKNEKYIRDNGRTISILSFFSKMASILLIIEVFLFVIDCIYFFAI